MFGEEEDTGIEIYFPQRDSKSIQKSPKYSYIDRLHELEIDQKIIEYICGVHQNSGGKGKFDDSSLLAWIVLGGAELGISVDEGKIAYKMKLNLNNSEYSKYISGTSGKTTSSISHSPMSIPIQIIPPSHFTEAVIFQVTSSFSTLICSDKISGLIEDIKKFSDEICQFDRHLKDDEPKTLECAICYVYFSFFWTIKKNKPLFRLEEVNPQKFTSYIKKLINIKYEPFYERKFGNDFLVKWKTTKK